jgi:hypothetical protein
MLANHVYGTTAGMRSALNGVDTAVNLTHAREAFTTPPTKKIGSIELLEMIGNVIANERTSGSIVRADADHGVLRLYFSGKASRKEVEAVLTPSAGSTSSTGSRLSPSSMRATGRSVPSTERRARPRFSSAAGSPRRTDAASAIAPLRRLLELRTSGSGA